jgi:hypothetical protein
MNSQNVFSGKRFYLLLFHAMRLHQTRLLIVAATVGLLVLLLLSVSALGHASDRLHQRLFPLTLFATGFILTGQAFRELRDPHHAMAWMLLPAGTFEKWVSRLFLTGFGYAVTFTIAWCLITALAVIISRGLFSIACPWFSPFHSRVILSIGLYTVLQSLFFVGAIYFRRLAFFKTILFLMLLGISLFVFGLLGIKVILGGDFVALVAKGLIHPDQDLALWLNDDVRTTLLWIWRIVFWGLLAPCCWVISYLRFKEFEV